MLWIFRCYASSTLFITCCACRGGAFSVFLHTNKQLIQPIKHLNFSLSFTKLQHVIYNIIISYLTICIKILGFLRNYYALKIIVINSGKYHQDIIMHRHGSFGLKIQLNLFFCELTLSLSMNKDVF